MKGQTSTLDLEKWGKWQRSLARIEHKLHMLYFAREMFERLDRHLRNHNYQNSPLFFHLQNTYVVYLAMGIRRLIDRTSKAQNLYQLLEDITENSGQISVDNYAKYMFKKKKHKERVNNSSNKSTKEKRVLIESYQKEERKLACRAFKNALGNKAQRLYCCDVIGDIKKIKDTKGRIGKLADKCWAHMDTRKPVKIKFAEAHKNLDLLIRIYNRYSVLTAGSKFDPHDKELFAQWDAPFGKPYTE